jgi:hypothetical protein
MGYIGDDPHIITIATALMTIHNLRYSSPLQASVIAFANEFERMLNQKANTKPISNFKLLMK